MTPRLHHLTTSPLDYWFPTWRSGSTALQIALRARSATPPLHTPHNPHRDTALITWPAFGHYAEQIPMDATCHVVGRHPIERLTSARALLLNNHAHIAAHNWRTLLATARHTTDGHLAPISRLCQKLAPRRILAHRIEDAAEWCATYGITMPPSNIARHEDAKEPMPEEHLQEALDIYREDFALFNYPLPTTA